MNSPEDVQMPPLHPSGVSDFSSNNSDTTHNSVELVMEQLQRTISEQHSQIQALRENEARLRYCAQHPSGLKWIMNRERQCVWVSEQMLEFTGLGFESFLKDGWRKCMHPDDVQNAFGTFCLYFDLRQDSALEFRLRRHDKKYRWIRDVSKPCFDDNGEFSGYVGEGTDITESKAADYERNLFQTFFYQSHEIQFVIENDRFTRVNNAFCNKLGYTPNELCNRGYLEFIYSEDIHKTVFEMDRLLAGERSSVFHNRFKCKDGSLCSVSWHTNVDLENRLIIASAHDITKQLAAEQQLRVLWLAMEQTAHSVVITDISHRIEYVNRAFCDISGYSESEVLGQNPRILQSGTTPKASYQAMFKTLQSGQTWEGEFINRRKSGEIYVETVRISPIRQLNGRITHYLGMKQEVTEYRRVLHEVEESKKLLQTVMDSTPDWIHVKDSDYRYLIVNRSYASAFNMEPWAMIGHCDEELISRHPNLKFYQFDSGVNHEEDDQVLMGDVIHNAARELFLDNGIRVFDTFKSPLRDSTQRVCGVISYARDVTERINNEQEQKELESQLRQSQKMELIGHLTGGIAHDFNNILASMLGYAEIMEMSAELQSNQKLNLYLSEIIGAGIRAKELVAQLLAFSHKRDAAVASIAVIPVLHEVLDMLKSAMPASIRLHYQFDDKLPPVLMSPVNLHQVMMNLVVNARDAVSKVGAIQINAAAVNVAGSRICTSCHREFSGDFVQISVADNGLGITQENLNRIFDPFFTTKAVGQGTGLGLAVLHGIVHSALGHVIVDSIEGRGTQFNVYLPTDTDQIVAPPVQVDGLPDMTRIRGNVMVIDDESSIVGFVTILLQNLGCHVIGLTRPVEALGLFRENPDGVDMVITDQSMPEMTGADLAAEMLKIRPDLPVVLCTGYSNLIDEEEIKDLGVQRWLSKPIPARVLVELVTEFLGPK